MEEEEQKCLLLSRLNYEQVLLMPESDEELSDLPENDDISSAQNNFQLQNENSALIALLAEFENIKSEQNPTIESQLVTQNEIISKDEKLNLQYATASHSDNDSTDLKHIPLFQKLNFFLDVFGNKKPSKLDPSLLEQNFEDNAEEFNRKLHQFCELNKRLLEATKDYCFYTNEEVFEQTRLHKTITGHMKSVQTSIYSKKKLAEEGSKEVEEEQGTADDLPALPSQVLDIRLKFLKVSARMVTEISKNIIESILFLKYETLEQDLNHYIKVFEEAIQANIKKDEPMEENKIEQIAEKPTEQEQKPEQEQINTNEKLASSVDANSLGLENLNERGRSIKKSRTEKACNFELTQHKQVFLVDIINDFQTLYSQHTEFMLKLTKNQVVIISDSPDNVQVETNSDITKLLKEKSTHFKKFESISLIESSDYSRLYDFKAFSAKQLALIVPNKEAVQGPANYETVLTQIHTNKLLAHSDHVAKILEEIIQYNPDKKKVVNYLAIAESSNTNLNTLVSLWSDKEKAKAQQEEFTPEKLAYFCIQAMEALNHCHSNNVYYGDMSPSSLMIFKDYAVKLGKFQYAIKLKNLEHHQQNQNASKNSSFLPPLAPNVGLKEQNEVYLEQTAKLKGYSSYSTAKIIEMGEDDREPEVSYQTLLENDYFSLVKTFQDIQLKFESEIPSESIIVQLVSDLASMDLNYFCLSQTLLKWKAILSNDKNFIHDLSSQLVKEEKFSALINILKISKYRNLFREIQSIFKQAEIEEQQQLVLANSQSTSKESGKKKKVITQFDYLYSQISLSQLQNPQTKVTNDLRLYIMKLLLYRGPMDSIYYKEFYFKNFSNLFLFKSDLFKQNVELSKVNFNLCPRILLIRSALKQKEEFERFLYFIIYTSAHTAPWFELRLSELIEVANEMKFPKLELELIYHYNKTQFDYNTQAILERKQNFAFRAKNLCRELEMKYDKAIECYLHALLCKIQVEGKIFRYDIKHSLSMIKVVENFVDYKKKSYFSLYYSMFAQAEEIKEVPNQKLKMLLKENAIFSQQSGISGELMLQNSFNLYLLYREGELRDIKKRDKYMKQLINCPVAKRRIEFLAFKLDDLLNQIEPADPVSTMKLERFLMNELIQLQKLSPFLYSLTLSYAKSELKLKNSSIIIQQEIKPIDRLDILNTQFFYSILKFLKPSIPIYLLMFQKYIGSPHSTEFRGPKLQYESWASSQYQEIFSQFRVTEFQKIETLPEKEEDKSQNKSPDQKSKIVSVVIPRVGKYKGEVSQNQFNGFGEFEFEGGNLYQGEFKNGLFNGKGELGFQQSDYHSYNGEFKENKLTGSGKLFYQNGDHYEGNFLNGLFHGDGIFQRIDGMKYMGRFEKHKRHGKGRSWFLSKPGDFYDGQWEDNEQNGKGKFTVTLDDNKQEIYDGLWKNNKRNGNGTQFYKNGVTYSGQWCEDLRNGHGTLARVGGFEFTGEWKDGDFISVKADLKSVVESDGEFFEVLRHVAVLENGHEFEGYITQEDKKFFGKGVLRYTDGLTYKGWFKNGKKNGYGELTYPNQDKYMGTFKDNKKFGPGVYQIATGQLNKVECYNNKQIVCVSCDSGDKFYEGFEVSSLKQGLGFFSDKVKKQTYSGYFIRDLMEGHGRLEYANGDSYIGQFSKGLRHGQGKLIFKEGGFYEGEFFMDVYHGKGKLSRKEQVNAKIQIKEENNERQQKIKEEKAQVNEEVAAEKILTLYNGYFQNGKKNGFGTYSYEDYEYRGNFKDDMKHGFGVYQTKYDQYREYYSEKFEGSFEKNLKHGFGRFKGIKSYYKIEYIGNFKDDKQSGYGKIFMEEDKIQQLIYEGEFQKGTKQGKGKKYQKRDHYVFIGLFMNGKKHGLGKKILQNGDKLIGEFKESQLTGYGTLLTNEGHLFKGQFRYNEQSGEGETIFNQDKNNEKLFRYEFNQINAQSAEEFIPLETTLQDEFKDFDLQNKFKEIMEEKINSQSDGEKKAKWREDLEYLECILEYFISPVSHKGLYKNALFEGKGVIVYKKCIFEGLFEYEKFKEGVLTFTEGKRKGEEYKGQFTGFRMTGEGTYRCKLGAVFTGEFFPTHRSSFASSFLYDNGDRYVGFLSPTYEKHGVGELTYVTGEVFKGRFLNNQRAEGILSLNGKTIYKGHYKNDRKHYFGKEHFELKGESFKYKGSYFGGFKYGKGVLKKTSGDNKFEKNVLITFELATRAFKCICTDNDEDVPIIEINQEISLKQGTITDGNGNIYNGDLINGVMIGTGNLTFPNKDLFTGGFIKGVIDGYGSYIWSNKSLYTGEFKNNIIEGFGLIQYSNGDQYRGLFVNGLREGKGTYTTKNKISYSGVFKNGTLDYGTYKDAEKKFSKGGKFDFNKKLFIYNEDIKQEILAMEEEETYLLKQSKLCNEEYEGKLERGMKQGQGKLKYPNGSIFEGTFQDNQRMSGKIITSSEDIITVEKFDEDDIIRPVEIIFKNGDKYVGKIADFKLEDENGRMEFKNGNSYEGNFVDNQIQGEGTFKTLDGTNIEVYKGSFVFGMRHGRGVITYQNEDSFDGVFREDEMVSGTYKKNKEQSEKQGGECSKQQQKAMQLGKSKEERSRADKSFILEQDKIICTNLKTLDDKYFSKENQFQEATKNQIICYSEKKPIEITQNLADYVAYPLVYRYSDIYLQCYSTPASIPDLQNLYQHQQQEVLKIISSDDQNVFELALEESQMRQLIKSPFIVQTKETILCYSKKLNEIFVIAELFDLKISSLDQLALRKPSEKIEDAENQEENKEEQKNEKETPITDELKRDIAKKAFILFQVMAAMLHLHSLGITVNNFLSKNIVMQSNFQVQIFDLSLAQLKNKENLYYPKQMSSKECSSDSYRMALAQYLRLSWEELIQNDIYGVTQLIQNTFLSTPNFESSTYYKWFKRFRNDFTQQEFEQNFEQLREEISTESDMKEHLMALASTENNLEGLQYIDFVIKRAFDLRSETFTTFVQPLVDLEQKLKLLRVPSLPLAFTHVFITDLNKKYKEIELYLPEFVKVKKGKESEFEFFSTDWSWLENLIKKHFRILEPSSRNESNFDWTEIEKQLLSNETLEKLLDCILSQVDSTGIISKKELLQRFSTRDYFKSYFTSNMASFLKQIDLIEKTEVPTDLDHLKSTQEYEKQFYYQKMKSENYTFERFQSVFKRMILLVDRSLSLAKDTNCYQNTDYQNIKVLSFIGKMLKIEEKDQYVLKNALITSNIGSAYNSFYEMIKKQKNFLASNILTPVDSVYDPKEAPLKLVQIFDRIKYLCSINYPFYSSESRFFYRVQDFKNSVNHVNAIIQQQDASIYGIYQFLEKDSNLVKFIEKPHNSESDHKCLATLNKLSVNFEIKVFLNTVDSNIPSNYEETCSYLKNMDFESSDNQKSSLTSDQMQQFCLIILSYGVSINKVVDEGYCLNAKDVKNDLRICLAPILARQQPIELGLINVYQLQVVQIDTVIKAMKIIYKIKDELAETPWYGHEGKSLSIEYEEAKQTVTLDVEKQERITYIYTNRDTHFGLKILTNLKNRYFFGDYKPYEGNESEFQYNQSHKVLWLETAFMPEDLDFPDPYDQQLYHLSFYETQ